MFAIYKKDLFNYFITPFGFIFIGLFLALTGIIFSINNIAAGKGDINGIMGTLNFISIVAFPVLTMKLLAEEKKQSTEQLLFSSTVTFGSIAVAKYLAAVTVFLIALILTGLYVVLIMIFGDISLGSVVVAYIGFALLGCTYISITFLASVLTDNQVTATIAGFTFLLLFILMGSLGDLIQIPVISNLISVLSILERNDSFTKGILDIQACLYYLSFSSVTIFITIAILKLRYATEGEA